MYKIHTHMALYNWTGCV